MDRAWDSYQKSVRSLNPVEGDVRVHDLVVPDFFPSQVADVLLLLVLGYARLSVFGFCLTFTATEVLSAVRARTARS